jgi:hypothetical protein
VQEHVLLGPPVIVVAQVPELCGGVPRSTKSLGFLQGSGAWLWYREYIHPKERENVGRYDEH